MKSLLLLIAVSISLCATAATSAYSSFTGEYDDNTIVVSSPHVFYLDEDNDGVGGSQTVTIYSDSAPEGYSSITGDCDDNDASITAPTVYYLDADGDGFGGSQTDTTCTTPRDGFTTVSGDFDDNNPEVNPNAVEVCNGIDDNCDGQIDENIAPLATLSGIYGPAGICKSQQSVFFYVNALEGATSYNWTVPAGAVIVGGQGTNGITVNFSSTQATGSICVTASNNCVNSSASCHSLAIYTAKPTTPTEINGSNIENCRGTTRSFSTPLVSNATGYTWINPANTTIVSGQGTNSIVLSFGTSFTTGILSVSATNCMGTSISRRVTLYSVPAAPSAISGPISEVCGGSTITYSCPAVIGATSYSWTVPADWIINSGQGTTSVSLTAPSTYSTASISVAAVSACGSSAKKTISVRAVPLQPGVISGPSNNLCGSDTLTYSIASVAGAKSYNWILPADANMVSNSGTSISVYFSSTFSTGTISVAAVNDCGSSIPRTLTLNSIPAIPSLITGAIAVCANEKNVSFSVAAVSNLTYSWTLPAGAVIVSGEGTASITADFGSIAGSVSVKAVNSCGSSTTRTKSVSIVSCRMDNASDAVNETTEAVEPVAYPNPGNGKATIASIKFDETTFLRVFASNGQLLRSESIPANTESWMLNLESEPNGLYLIQMETNTGVKNIRYMKK